MVGSSNKQPHKEGSRSVHRHSVEDVEVMSQRRRAETAAFIVAADNGGQYWRRELKQVSKFSWPAAVTNHQERSFSAPSPAMLVESEARGQAHHSTRPE